jgi:2-polyprenyl-3-methyl-5-hydroxy-6-metoxy-1,4-benzoquinol methylase
MLKSFLRRTIGIKLSKKIVRFLYYVVGGGGTREKILISLLKVHYDSKFRRVWVYSEEPPHFYDHRIGGFYFVFGKNDVGPYSFYRGFFSSEVIREGDRLLDIGCGDGFFTKRFLSDKCAHVDAIDIEPTAIKTATIYNNDPRISYSLLDAVVQPFPNKEYDVIVLDSVLGHLAPETTIHMLTKMRSSLTQEGVFVGSESLTSREGHDHLQFFDSLDDLYLLFKPFFKHIHLRRVNYRIGLNRDFIRQEAYWRCSNSLERLQECGWQMHYGGAHER